MIVEDVEYRIACQCLNSQKYVPIDKKAYEDIKSAYKGLLEARYLEEKYDSLLQNFYEYELELSKLATRHMLFGDYDYIRFQNEINTLNRRIINLLTTCRLYIDHSSHHLNQIFNGDISQKKAVKLINSSAYDNNLGYRVMEAFRNYVQHRGFPIHNFTYGSQWTEDSDKPQLLFSVAAHFDIVILDDGGKFKKSVLDELQKKAQKHDINMLMREYIAALSDVHRQYREMINEKIDAWEETFNSAIEKYRETAGSEASILGLSAITYVQNKIIDSVPIFMELIKYRKYLENKNGNLSSLPSRHVDNSIRDSQ